MGCLFVLMAGFFPRFRWVIFWILRPVRVDAAFTSFVWPVLRHHLPAVHDIALHGALRAGRLERVGVVSGGDRRVLRCCSLGGKRHTAKPGPRLAR